MGRNRSRKHSLRKRVCVRKLSQAEQEVEPAKRPSSFDKHLNPEGELWARNLTPAETNVMACLKMVAMERAATLGDLNLAGILDWKTLYCIYTVLEEFSKEGAAFSAERGPELEISAN